MQNATAQNFKGIIAQMIAGYTAKPVDLRMAEMDSTILFELQGENDDHRRLVGTRGRHIWSLQRLAGLAGGRLGKTVRLALIDPKPGSRGRDLDFTPVADWNSGPFMGLIRDVLYYTAPDGTGATIGNAGHNTTVEVSLPAIGPAFGDFAQAMQALFFAIGKMEGRMVELKFLGPKKEPVEYKPL